MYNWVANRKQIEGFRADLFPSVDPTQLAGQVLPIARIDRNQSGVVVDDNEAELKEN